MIDPVSLDLEKYFEWPIEIINWYHCRSVEHVSSCVWKKWNGIYKVSNLLSDGRSRWYVVAIEFRTLSESVALIAASTASLSCPATFWVIIPFTKWLRMDWAPGYPITMLGPLVVSCFYHPTVDTSTRSWLYLSTISTIYSYVSHVSTNLPTLCRPHTTPHLFYKRMDHHHWGKNKPLSHAQRRSLGLRYRLCSAHLELRPSGLMPEKSIPDYVWGKRHSSSTGDGGEGCWSVCFLLLTDF